MTKVTDNKLDEVLFLVNVERKRRSIQSLSTDMKSEGSGFSRGVDGDILSLIERQLLITKFGYGAWQELKNPKILSETLRVLREQYR